MQLYRDLGRLEADFETVNIGIKGRPIGHRTESLVRAHAQVTWLALVLDCALQRLLRQNPIGMSTYEA